MGEIQTIIHHLIHTISAHPQLAYGTLWLVAFLEAVPVVGSLIPGSTVILSLSALIATGDLDLIGVLAAAMTGAAIGDGTAFWLGHDYPKLVYGVWPLTRYPDVIRRSERFFQERGSVAVFLARFVPPVRAFIPIVAGGLGMPPRRFFVFNLLAIALWAPAHVVPGILAGTAYRRAGVIAEHLLLPVLAGLLAIGLLVWAFRRMRANPPPPAGTSDALES